DWLLAFSSQPPAAGSMRTWMSSLNRIIGVVRTKCSLTVFPSIVRDARLQFVSGFIAVSVFSASDSGSSDAWSGFSRGSDEFSLVSAKFVVRSRRQSSTCEITPTARAKAIAAIRPPAIQNIVSMGLRVIAGRRRGAYTERTMSSLFEKAEADNLCQA